MTCRNIYGYGHMSKPVRTTAPTEDLIESMGEVAVTLHSSFTALLSAAVRLAEAGQDGEAKRLVDLAKVIRHAEETVRSHTKDARAGRIVKLNLH